MSMSGAIGAARRIIGVSTHRTPWSDWEEIEFHSLQGLGAYWGVYGSFAEARAALPENPGFDLPALASEYINVRTKRVYEYDRPVMRWLEKAFGSGASAVLDIGGSVGAHYYAYRKYLRMPGALCWEIVEVPAIAAIGRDLALQHQATALSFTTNLSEAVLARSHDVWIAAEALQYVEDGHLANLLDKSSTRPTHVLLNKIPLYRGEDFVTTQNLGEGSYAPLYVYNKRRFIRSIEERGYTLKDCWDVNERWMYIPGHPKRSFKRLTGLYFADNRTQTVCR